MFSKAYACNQPIGDCTVKVTSTRSMFQEATVFNQAIGNWVTASVRT